MRICAFIQMFNEVRRGNLVRCLENVRQWADDVCIYDDASTDSSVDVAKQYTSHIILGEKNAITEELFHKQRLLEYALRLNPDWIMWVDCDEILDRRGTLGGLRKLAEKSPKTVDAYSFHEINLWRSQTYARIDSLFDKGWFCRLWRVVPGIRIKVEVGVHLRLYPITIRSERILQAPYGVIHYGFWDYRQMLVKIGAHWCDGPALQRIAPDNWILNETKCKCYRVPMEWFPPENEPPNVWPEPTPRATADLVPYSQLPYFDSPAE